MRALLVGGGNVLAVGVALQAAQALLLLALEVEPGLHHTLVPLPIHDWRKDNDGNGLKNV